MHDIDRTTMEYGQETSSYEGEQFEFGQGEWSGESGLNEQQEAEFAQELLNVNNEAELDRFLGDFIRKVGATAGRVIRSPIGQAIGGVLKGVAKKALPLAGGAIGGYFGGPLGAKIGSGLASAAGGALGLEGEMSGEDREFEGARQFVRLAADTVHKASQAPASGDPRMIAQNAATAAARQHAPGLLGRGAGCGSCGGAAAGGGAGFGANGTGMSSGTGMAAGGGRGASGRWSRQGNKIVLYGA
ncbi:hypothetical protein LXA47_12960 [Massilia sp. P8910]|uniref:hypothetical protein n=1 Tax=Massilia antarctica TaxID=2765360 RepID=UPI0006BD898A|nr:MULTISPECIES: hypothetical protein [Massilia]MCE3604514.1 hypothetical protein [Massilia antarctica]MCY0913842.1 hypothetical protein [Massilia sp. H27-R4]CUI04428.1 hypothetical protein BN2497_3633 [Janthinobacterium sp. CG23_2]CUU28214.1 hypothetical protein BN3177_3633 [Janthinobacterium sp. CG23_2]